jgi:hypothetical protein
MPTYFVCISNIVVITNIVGINNIVDISNIVCISNIVAISHIVDISNIVCISNIREIDIEAKPISIEWGKRSSAQKRCCTHQSGNNVGGLDDQWHCKHPCLPKAANQRELA